MTAINNKLVSFVKFNGKIYQVADASIGRRGTIFHVRASAGSPVKFERLSVLDCYAGARIDWGDGHEETYAKDADGNSAASHIYGTDGEYAITVSDRVKSINATGGGPDGQFLSIEKIGSNVTAIDALGMAAAEAFEKIDFSESNVTDIKASAFYNDAKLTSANFEESVISSIGNSAFQGTSIPSVSLPPTIKSIGQRAFSANSTLTSVSIPEGAGGEGFGGFCFYYDYNLQKFDLPASPGNAKNDQYQMRYVGSITPSSLGADPISVKIPGTWRHIPQYIFSGVSRLSVVEIPSSVNTIYRGAFADGDDGYKLSSGVYYSPLINGLQHVIFKDRSIDEIPEIYSYSDNTRSLTGIGSLFSDCTHLGTVFANRALSTYYRQDEAKNELVKFLGPFIRVEFEKNGQVSSYLYVKNFDPVKLADTNAPAFMTYLSNNYLDAAPGHRDMLNSCGSDSCLSGKWFISHMPSDGGYADAQYFNDAERLSAVVYTSAYADAWSVYDGPASALYWICDKRPTTVKYSDGTTAEIFNGGTFTSADISARAGDITAISFGKYSTFAIGANALMNCGSLVSVYIPATVYSIGGAAFYGCSSLETAVFEHSRSAVYLENAFNRCSGLKTLSTEFGPSEYGGNTYFPVKGSKINNTLFYNCSSLSTNLEFFETNTIDCYTTSNGVPLYKCQMKALSFPVAKNFGSNRHIHAFHTMSQLEYLNMPEIENMNCEYAFRDSGGTLVSVDFRGRTKQSIPTLGETFFRRDSRTKKDFVVMVPYEISSYGAYGNWCVADNWAQYAGDFTCEQDPDFSVENATSALFQNYLTADSSITLTKNSGEWELDGVKFEGNYGTINTSLTSDTLTFNYTRGKIIPFM